MSSANGKKIWALMAAGLLGSTAATASAAEYLTVSLLGSVGGGPYSSSLVVNPGDVVSYKVQIQLGEEGSTNQFAQPLAQNRIITNWIPSHLATNPGGLNTVSFNIQQAPTPGTIQVDFDDPTTPQTTGGVPWGGVGSGAAATPGTVSPRGNGNDDLNNVILSRAAGTFDGIGGTDGGGEIYELLDLAVGTFDVASGGASSTVNLNLNGFAGNLAAAAMRWRDTLNRSTSITPDQQNASVTGSDPLIIFNGLTLNPIPEPASLGLLGLAAVGALGRRRRA